MTWQERAACRDAPTELFFPSRKDDPVDQAKAFCQRCEVRTECLEDALVPRTYRTVGVWGATTEEERDDIRPALPPKACEWCGERFQPARPRSRFHSPRCASSASTHKARMRRAS